MADQRIDIDVSKALADIAQMKGGLHAVVEEVSRVGKAADAAFGKGFNSNMASESLRKVLDEIRALSINVQVYASNLEKTGKAGKAAADTQRVAVQNLHAEYLNLAKGVRKSMEDGTQVTSDAAKQLLVYRDELKKAEQGLSGQANATAAVAQKTSLFSSIIKASPIGFLIGLLSVVVAKFLSFQSVTDKVSQAMAAASAVTNVLFERLTSLATSVYNAGKAMVLFVSGDFTGAVKAADESVASFKQTFDGLSGALVNAGIGAFNLQKRIQDLRDAQIAAAVAIQRQAQASEVAQRVAEDESKTFDQRAAAIRRAISLEASVASQRKSFAAQSARLAKEEFSFSAKSVEDKQKVADAEIFLIETQGESAEKRIQLIDKLNKIEKQRADFLISNLAFVQAAIAKIESAVTPSDPIEDEVKLVRDKYAALRAEAEKGLKKLSEIEREQPLSDSQLDDRAKLGDLIVALHEKQTDEEIAAVLRGLKKLSEAREAANLENEKHEKREIASAKKALEDIRAIRESEIDITEAEMKNLISVLEAGGVKQEKIAIAQSEFERQIQAKRIESEIAFQEGLLGIKGLFNDAEVAQIKNHIAALNVQLEGLDIPGGGKKGGKAEPIITAEDLGVSEHQLAEIQKGVDSVKSILSDLAGAEVDAAERAIEAAEKKIDAAQKAYDKEKELNEQGFANNLDLAARALEAAKAEEAKAQAQKERAIKRQQQLDTVLQVSSLVTASAQTLAQFPGPLLPIGIALVAAMFGAFLAAKIRAKQASKFRHGGEGRVDGNGFVVGASHEQGGVAIEAEGGEMFATDGKRFAIVNKEMSARHFDLLKAVNANDKQGMRRALERIVPPAINTTGALAAVGISDKSAKPSGAHDAKTYNLLKKQFGKPKKTVTVEGDWVVEREGSKTRRRRIQK